MCVLRLTKNLWPNPVGLPPASCPEPSGTLAGARLGPITLGQRRQRLRVGLARVSRRTQGSTDTFCFADRGLTSTRAGARRLLSAFA